MIIVVLSVIVILMSFIDNFKYFLLAKKKVSKGSMKKFLIISIMTRVVILAYSVVRWDWTFIIVYFIGLVATLTAYYKRKHATLEVK